MVRQRSTAIIKATRSGVLTLLRPFECLLFDDTKVFHAVSPIEAEFSTRGGTRDVLVITFSTTRR